MNQRRVKWSQALATVLLIAGVSMLAVDALAGVHIKRTLRSTGVDDDARGQSVVVINHNGGRGRLVVHGAKLDPRSTFAVTLGGVRIGTLATNARGNGRARFSSRPGPRDQTLGTDPRGKHLEVADEDGEDVLDDDIPDDGVDPGEVACCLPDDGGSECEDRTADECGREGGSAPGPASCIPNPCGTTPPEDQEIGCCVPDDDGAECERTTETECSDRHGTKVDTCDPNPCTSSVPGIVRCCIPEHESGDDSGSGRGSGGGGSGGDDGGTPECEQLTAQHCMDEGGSPMDPGPCDPNPCPAAP